MEAAVLPTEARDTGEARAAHEHEQDHKPEDGAKGMELTMSIAWIGHCGESFDE